MELLEGVSLAQLFGIATSAHVTTTSARAIPPHRGALTAVLAVAVLFSVWVGWVHVHRSQPVSTKRALGAMER